MADDLAAGFQDVDRAADFATFSQCLTLIDSIPFFATCKSRSYELLGITAGSQVADIGCGLGDDAAALAKLVAPGGSVVGVDASHAMVAAAGARHRDLANASFRVADVADLPFGDGRFDACRVDRVLQHVPDPVTAIREMVRVLRPGGTLVAFDNDWETLIVDCPDRVTTRAVMNAWCDRFPSGWIGRQMPALFRAAGLLDVAVEPRTLVLDDLDVADRVFSLFITAEGLAAGGVVRRTDLDRWAADLRSTDAAGQFFCSYTGFLVRGTRPTA